MGWNLPDRSTASTGEAIQFGDFRLLPAEQLLLEAGKPLRLGGRALDILIALVERPGVLVTKEELIARVWPSTFVDEGNLRVHLSALRRALGDGQAGVRYIASVPGRGYQFVAPVMRVDTEFATPPDVAVPPPHNLPVLLTRTLGRAGVVDLVAAQLPQRRFVTLVGPGGIGKTVVALAVADALAAGYPDGVGFVDLGPLSSPGLVPSALAAVLRLPINSEDPVPGLIAFLRDRRMLVLLDCCEHVVEAAAALAEAIFLGAPGVHILATSREALRAAGEVVHRLPPLESPPADTALTAAEALGFPAVQLFVERAAASLDGFTLTDADAPVVAEICRRLDGVALAIELAAARVDSLGLQGLAGRLNDRFHLLTRGRRTALARHQTLAATLDWSYEFLPEAERTILRRLALFTGGFTPEAAGAVAGGEGLTLPEVDDGVANLVAKSLIAADVSGDTVQYRLLETTRAYALGKLTASGEQPLMARRHAGYVRGLLEHVATDWEIPPGTQWLRLRGGQIGDLRAALDWAFAADGDAALGVAVTLAAVPLWMHLSLVEECRARAEQALARGGFADTAGAHHKMQLLAALGAALHYTRSPVLESGAVWSETLALAEQFADAEYQLRALWGLWNHRLGSGEHRAALALAERFRSLAAAKPDPAMALIGDRIVGVSLHYLGDEIGARQRIERMISQYVPPEDGSHTVRFQSVQLITARSNLAWLLWIQGLPEQAMRTAAANVADAQATGHTISLCHALEAACLVALLTGDIAISERYVATLRSHAERHGVGRWDAWSRCFEGVLLTRAGNVAAGVPLIGIGLDDLRKAGFALRFTAFLGDLAEALGRCGETAKGLAAVDEALARCERTEERWCVTELQRIRGELLLQTGAADAVPAVEAGFLQSLAWARQQNALSWEVRTSMSLAALWHRQGRTGKAHALLAAAFARFIEGFATADLVAARSLLGQLRQAGSPESILD